MGFLFCDLETTGLDASEDVILEVGLTLYAKDSYFSERIWEYTSLCSDSLTPPRVLDSFVHEMHTKNGLLEELDTYVGYPSSEIDTDIVKELKDLDYTKGELILVGNSISFDRKFIHRYMPKLDDFLHYRMIDISSIGILCEELNPAVQANRPPGKKLHRVQPDITDSYNQLQYYIDNFLWTV